MAYQPKPWPRAIGSATVTSDTSSGVRAEKKRPRVNEAPVAADGLSDRRRERPCGATAIRYPHLAMPHISAKALGLTLPGREVT